MKKPKPKKIRKVWSIKPKTRIHNSRKREALENNARRDLRRLHLDGA